MTDRHRPPPTRIVLPWWDADWLGACESGTAPELPSLRWLQARAARWSLSASPWRDWLLAAAGFDAPLSTHFPAGPCVLAATSSDTQSSGWWGVAQPVHLAAAIDHLRLAPTHTLAITPEEATALQATVSAHLPGTGFELRPGTPALWCLSCQDPLECTTHEPAEVIGRNIREFMPGGRDGKTIRTLTNEIQMLLHEHPVNERRARGGLPAINSLWLWGFGQATPTATRSLPTLVTDDGWLQGVWVRHGAAPLAIDRCNDLIHQRDDGALLALTRPPATTSADALAHADAGVLRALRKAVEGGVRRSVEIHTGTRVLVLDRFSRWRFWRRPRPLDPVTA